MELAKIRNKAKPQPDPGAEEVGAQNSIRIEPESVSPLPLPVISEITPDEGAVNLLSSAASQFSVQRIAKYATFDPMAIILSGREADLQKENRAALPEATSEGRTDQELYEEYLCFRLGSEEYGISIMEIKEIIKPRELTEVPRAPHFIDGVISLRGLIVPVIDMRKRLSLPHSHRTAQQRLVIAKNGDSLTGLLVDEVTGVVRIPERMREITPAALDGIDRDFVTGIGRTDNRMFILLDVSTIANVALSGRG